MTTEALEPPLDTARHIRYWQRCQRTLLPHHYTSNDSTRLTIGYFILAALDLLSSPSSYTSSDPPSDPVAASLIPAKERSAIRAWILSLQHPQGGFCGSPHHVLQGYQTTHIRSPATNGSTDDSRYTQRGAFPSMVPSTETHRDPENANIAATYFALLALGVLAEDNEAEYTYMRVHRLKTLRWLKRLQRDDGSFGENVDADGYIAGGRDMRPCYLAATIRWILGGAEAGPEVDFDVEKLVAHVRRSQAFDGGIAESSMHESHAGYAYCAVAALSLLDLANPDSSASRTHYLEAGIPSIPSLLHFLVSRQFAYLDSTSESGSSTPDPDASVSPPDLATLSLSDPTDVVGFNGRLNKAADSCYVWWVTGALALLGESGLVDRAPARRFIIAKTEHLIGGFAKHPGGPPDVYHAYLGLAALATMVGAEGEEGEMKSREEGLGRFDPRLCVGAEAADRIRRGREGLINPRPRTPDSEDGKIWIEL